MNEMVDRIAATLYGGDLRDCYHPEMFRRQARKCIEAMREPTGRQCVEGHALIERMAGIQIDHPLMAEAWSRMVDEALKDA